MGKGREINVANAQNQYAITTVQEETDDWLDQTDPATKPTQAGMSFMLPGTDTAASSPNLVLRRPRGGGGGGGYG